MAEPQEKKHPVREFVKTYPRFIPFCIILLLIAAIVYALCTGGFGIAEKWKAEWDKHSVSEYEATVKKAEAEKQAAQLYKEAAELYAEAIEIRSNAEAAGNRTVEESLSDTLMEYYRLRAAAQDTGAEVTENEATDSVQHGEGYISNP